MRSLFSVTKIHITQASFLNVRGPSALLNSTESGGANEAVQIDVLPCPGSAFFNYACNVNAGSASKLLVDGGSDVSARKVIEAAGCALLGQGSEPRASACDPHAALPPLPRAGQRAPTAFLPAHPALHPTRLSTCAACAT